MPFAKRILRTLNEAQEAREEGRTSRRSKFETRGCADCFRLSVDFFHSDRETPHFSLLLKRSFNCFLEIPPCSIRRRPHLTPAEMSTLSLPRRVMVNPKLLSRIWSISSVSPTGNCPPILVAPTS